MAAGKSGDNKIITMPQYIIHLTESRQVLSEYFEAKTTHGEVRHYTRITKVPALFWKFKSKREAKQVGDKLGKPFKIEPFPEQKPQQHLHATAKTLLITSIKSIRELAKVKHI